MSGRLLKSYLSDRKQFVKSEVRSECLSIEYGISQDSVLGLLLFLLFINDIRDFSGDSNETLFADDAVVKKMLVQRTKILQVQ